MSLRIALLGTALALLAACTTRQEYQSLAEAGAAYAETVPPLLAVACQTQVDASSWDLIMNRKDAGRIAEAQLERRTAADRDRCAVLGELSQHASLLSDYFGKLRGLAVSDADREVGESAGKLFGKVQDLGGRLLGQQVFPVALPMQEIASFAIRAQISAALRDELEARKDALQKELLLQEQLLNTIGDQLAAARAAIADIRVQTLVIEPLVDGAGVDPAELVRARRAQVIGDPAVSELRRAAEAAAKLRRGLVQILSQDLSKEVVIARLSELWREIRDLKAVVAALVAASS